MPSPDPLTALGLTPYGTRVYIALASSCTSRASDIADNAKVPRQRVYDILNDLMNRGMVERIVGKPNRYMAVEPTTAVKRLIQASRLELGRYEDLALRLAAQLRPAWGANRSSGAQPQQSGQITLTEVGQWCDLAQHRVLTTTRPPFQGLGDLSWLRHVERLTLAGGTVRCIYQDDILDDPDLLAKAHCYAEAGESARIASRVPTWMMVTDSRRALLPMPAADDAQPVDGVLLIDHSDVVSKLEEEFEALWVRSAPLPAARPARRPQSSVTPTPRTPL